MKSLSAFLSVATTTSMLFAAPIVSAQALNVAMPLGSMCPVAYHWEMADGFAQCIADSPPVPPTPPSSSPSTPQCGGSYPGYYDWPGTFVYFGYYDIQNGDSGGRGPGVFVWFNGVKIFENRAVDLGGDWSAGLVANMPAGYSAAFSAPPLAYDSGNGNATAFTVLGVCKN